MENFTEIIENIEICPEYLSLLSWRAQNRAFLEQYAAEQAENALLAPGVARKATVISGMQTVHGMLAEIERLFEGETNINKKHFFNLILHVQAISKKIGYFSCGIKDCKKKISEQNGVPFCEKCKKTVRVPKLRFMVDVGLQDTTGSFFARVFGNENCFDFFGKQPQELD